MNRGKQFWHLAWDEGRISFHQDTINADLMLYWPQLAIAKGARVLVPLCGKSLDMLWLIQQGLQVIGIELCEPAVGQFIHENRLSMTRNEQESTVCYLNKDLRIWVDDIFMLNHQVLQPPLEAIYDRAALVALPQQLRGQYVDFCLSVLQDSGKILLKTLSYEQSLYEGPPFSVDAEEVVNLYAGCKNVQLISQKINKFEPDHPLYQRGLTETHDWVWIIEK